MMQHWVASILRYSPFNEQALPQFSKLLVSLLQTAVTVQLQYRTSTTSRVLASKHLLARIIANKRGVVHVLLSSIHLTYKRGVARILLVCHTPFISNYSRLSKFLLSSTRNVAFERYRTHLALYNRCPLYSVCARTVCEYCNRLFVYFVYGRGTHTRSQWLQICNRDYTMWSKADVLLTNVIKVCAYSRTLIIWTTEPTVLLKCFEFQCMFY